MKNLIKYCGVLILTLFVASSCEETSVGGDEALDYGTDPIVAGFTATEAVFPISADGEVKIFDAKIYAMGPNIEKTTANVTLTYSIDEAASTAEEGVHYLSPESNTITLTADNNYLGIVPIKILTEGLEAPLSKTIVLKVESIESADPDVVLSGNTQQMVITVNYLCFSDLAGTYYIQYSDGSTLDIPIYANGPGQYIVDNLFTVSPSGFDWYFTDNCGELTVTGFELSSYTLLGTGVVNEDGSLTFIGVDLVGITGPVNFTMYPLP